MLVGQEEIISFCLGQSFITIQEWKIGADFPGRQQLSPEEWAIPWEVF